MAKGRKTGGRTKGTPNKKTVLYGERLSELKFDCAAEAVKLYRSIPNNPLWAGDKARILSLMTGFATPRPKESEPLDELDTVSTDEYKPKTVRELISELTTTEHEPSYPQTNSNQT